MLISVWSFGGSCTHVSNSSPTPSCFSFAYTVFMYLTVIPVGLQNCSMRTKTIFIQAQSTEVGKTTLWLFSGTVFRSFSLKFRDERILNVYIYNLIFFWNIFFIRIFRDRDTSILKKKKKKVGGIINYYVYYIFRCALISSKIYFVGVLGTIWSTHVAIAENSVSTVFSNSKRKKESNIYIYMCVL